MHRRKDLWGEDAEEFKPIDGKARSQDGSICHSMAVLFALTEASYVTVRLLQRFDALQAAPQPEGPITSNLTLTNCPGNPVTLRMHAAKS
ncbi:hypothetical protein LTR17_014467 [Elasticomyces elasticus]|nr:hypothetical protein LTR17_014467 [Elasticomyces elasticus]